ncbi:hypothetical protein GC173_04325 [bacterium]|nr:hypothetical protein [bacterium]
MKIKPEWMMAAAVAIPILLCVANQAARYPETMAWKRRMRAKEVLVSLSTRAEAMHRETGASPRTIEELGTSEEIADPFMADQKPLMLLPGGVYSLLVSRGPDKTFELSTNDLKTTDTRLLPQLLVSRSYDPTNGTLTGGDMWIVLGTFSEGSRR